MSSVQDKKQCDPEKAAAKGKTTWGKWAMERQQKQLWFYFHARRGSRCSSCVSTRTTRKSQAQWVGHNQQIFHKDNFCFSLLILHSAHLKIHHWITQITAFIAQNNWFLPGLNTSRVFLCSQKCLTPENCPPKTEYSLMLADEPSEKYSKTLLAEPVFKPNSTERQN